MSGVNCLQTSRHFVELVWSPPMNNDPASLPVGFQLINEIKSLLYASKLFRFLLLIYLTKVMNPHLLHKFLGLSEDLTSLPLPTESGAQYDLNRKRVRKCHQS